MALNYDYYCLGENNRLYFADKNYIGYSDNHLTEAKKVKYDGYGDVIYYLGYYKDKLYMIKKYNIYEVDPTTFALTEIKHSSMFFDWYSTSYGIIDNLLYYSIRYNSNTSYYALHLDTRQILNVSASTSELLNHKDAVQAVSFRGINKAASVYDSVNKTYNPVLERYELNSKCELEKASVITVPVSLSRITKAFVYDDNHIGIYANSLISIYNIHTGALLHQITSTVQSSYVIYGLRSSSNDFITLIKESSSSVKLYSNTKLLKTHTTFKDFKRQGQVVTYIVYRADDAIQVVKVGIQKQSGSIPLSLSERIYAQDKQLLDLQEKAYAEAYTALQLNERIVMSNKDTVPLKGRVVETIHTKDLALKGYVREPQNGEILTKETISAREKQTLDIKEYVDKLLPIIEKDLIAGITQMTYFDDTLYVVSNDIVYYTTDYKTFNKYGFGNGSYSFSIASSDHYLYIAYMLEEDGRRDTMIHARPKKGDSDTYHKKVFSNLEPTKLMVTPDDSMIVIEESNQERVLYVEDFFSQTYTVSDDRALNKGFGSLVGVEHAPNDDPLYSDYVYHMYLVKDGVLSGFEWNESHSSKRIPEKQLAYGTLSHVKLLKHHTVGYVVNSTLYVKDYIKNKILYSIVGVAGDYGYKEVGADVYITVFAYGNFDLYKNGVRIHRIPVGFGGNTKATCNSPHALMAALSDTQETKHKLYGFNLSLLSYTLQLQEEVIENNTMKIKGNVYDSQIAHLTLTEEVLSGLATLDLEETIISYTKDHAVLSIKEKALKPNQDLITMNLTERSCFKPGEWGEGKRNLSLSGKVVPVPYQAIWVKGEVINKPVPTDIIDLGLKENVWAYHTFITQKENAWSDKVYWYYRDGILGDAVYVQEGKTAFITTEWTIMAHDKVIFEVDSKNIILDSVRLDTLDGLKFETIRNIKCDSYTLKDAYTGEIKQVYGFVIGAPFDCNNLQIRNKGKGFTLLKLYDGYNPSTMGAHSLNLTEAIESQSSALPMKETIWWEGQAHKRYFNLTERVYAKAPTDKTLSIKGEVGGLDGSQTAALKGVVKLSDLDVYATLYRCDLGKPYETIKLMGLPSYLHDNQAALIAFPREKVNWDGRALLQIQAEWHDWWLVIGYRKKGSEAIEQVLCTFDSLKSYQIDASFDITMYLHYFIKSQLGHADLITDRIAYIGVMGANYQGGMTMFSMQMTRHNYQSQVTLGTKEKVISHVRASYQPLHLQTTEGTYTYNEVIDFTPIMAAPTDYDVFTYLERRFFASQIELVSEDKVLFATLELTNGKVHEVHATTTHQQNGRYYYTYDTSNIADCMINKLAFRYEKRHETKIYELILYHDGYRASDKFMLKENIPRPFDKQVAIKENVMLVPEVTLPLKEEVDKLIKEGTAISLREYVAMPDHSVGNADLKLQEKSVPPTYSRSIWLNELVPSEPQENALSLHEYVIASEAHDLTLKEKVVQYKANSDGKVIIENVKH